jgi:peptide deformylase
MKALPIVQFGDPVLRTKTKPLTLAQIRSGPIQKLIPLMFYTMRNIGVGLAAPQVGLPLRLAVIEVKPLAHRTEVEPFPKTVVINPIITSYSKKQSPKWEGCLSLRNVAAEAMRSESVTVRYLDQKGKPHTKKFTGFTAQVFQHEIDHLNGTLYVDRVKDIKTLISTEH